MVELQGRHRFIPTLTTARLTLRPFRIDDAPRLRALAGDPRIADTTQNIPHPYLPGMAEAWIAGHHDSFAQRQFLVLAIVAGDELIGAISLRLEPAHRRGELGYWIGVPHWGRGYATEAAVAVIDYGFRELDLNRISATHLTRNPASGRVMEKAGMRFEGTFRQHVLKNGRLEDLAGYAILRSDRDRPPTLAERRFDRARAELRGKDAAAVFDFIHRTNLWGSDESRSGLGSETTATQILHRAVPPLLRELRIRSLRDLPCGDFGWLSQLDLGLDRYLGGDIVSAIVAANREHYRLSHPHASFHVLDLVVDVLPSADAMLCRDCLVHLPISDIEQALRNIATSDLQFVITTTFTDRQENPDIERGDWRPLNLERPPFSLPRPLAVILEGCTEENGAYADKALGVWSIDAIRQRFAGSPAEREPGG